MPSGVWKWIGKNWEISQINTSLWTKSRYNKLQCAIIWKGFLRRHMSLKIKYMFSFNGKLYKYSCHWVAQKASWIRKAIKQDMNKWKYSQSSHFFSVPIKCPGSVWLFLEEFLYSICFSWYFLCCHRVLSFTVEHRYKKQSVMKTTKAHNSEMKHIHFQVY